MEENLNNQNSENPINTDFITGQQTSNLPPSPPPEPDRYSNNGNKIGDFMLGFFGIITLSVIIFFVLPGVAFLLSFIVPFVLIGVILSVFFIPKSRRFIKIGIISALMMPVVFFALAFGMCYLSM